MHCISVEGLTYSYFQGITALKNISFSIETGQCQGIIGLNGCGKTTLCYCLCGIIPYFLGGTIEGRVLVNGNDTQTTPLHRLTDDIGIVLQDPNDQLLMPTVEDELALGLENNRIPRAEMERRISQTLDMVGIREIRKESTNSLSGGQKRLVALAAVLVLQPSIIVFDESLSMLDQEATTRVIEVMKMLKTQKRTLIIVDHTFQAFDLFDKVLVLEDGQVVYQGDNEFLRNNREFFSSHGLQLRQLPYGKW